MKLDSCRELKAQLAGRIFERMAMSAEEVSGYGMPARNVKRVEAIRPTIALGVSQRRKGYRVAVRIQRRGMERSRHLQVILKEAKGEVDVRYVGRVVKRASWFQSRHRPLRIGTSIGHAAVSAGTLGCFVRTKDGEPCILSNNHVLADENKGKRGDPILQPAVFDGGKRPGDIAGRLAKYVRLRRNETNTVDCATCTVGRSVEFNPSRLRGVGPLAGVVPPGGDVDLVVKLGRTSGRTRGRVTAFEMDNLVVAYDMGILRFDDQVEIEDAENGSFSEGGDSGSLIFTASDRLGFALLFAGSEQGGSNGKGLTYANPLTAVLDSLKVELLT
ncbi:MAG: hypothetical protein ACRDH8_06800 [Actinomycetota bacterium]